MSGQVRHGILEALEAHGAGSYPRVHARQKLESAKKEVETLSVLLSEAMSAMRRAEENARVADRDGESHVRRAQLELRVKWVDLPLNAWLRLVHFSRRDPVQMAAMACTSCRFRDMLFNCEAVAHEINSGLAGDLQRISRELQLPQNALSKVRSWRRLSEEDSIIGGSRLHAGFTPRMQKKRVTAEPRVGSQPEAADEVDQCLVEGKFCARWGHGQVRSRAAWGEYSEMRLECATGSVDALQSGTRVPLLKLKDIDRVEVQQGEPRRVYITANETRRLEVLVASEHGQRPVFLVIMCSLQAWRRKEGLQAIATGVIPPIRDAELTLVLVHRSPGPLGITAALGRDDVPTIVALEKESSAVPLGVRLGDRILGIDGEPTGGLRLPEVRGMLQSLKRPLRLTLEREPSEGGDSLGELPGAAEDTRVDRIYELRFPLLWNSFQETPAPQRMGTSSERTELGLLLGAGLQVCELELDQDEDEDLEAALDLEHDPARQYQPLGNKKEESTVTVIHPKGFRKLRHLVFGDEAEQYAEALVAAEEITFTGGKAAKDFFISGDRRFVIKVIKAEEGAAFQEKAAEYLTYLYEREGHGQQSLLVKIFGLYQVSSKALGSIHVIVQEHLWPQGTTMLRKFDIKGIAGRRQLEEGSTGFEDNLSDFTHGKPLLVTAASKQSFDVALARDLEFLEKTMYVLDYSLLCGVDQVNRSLVVGIVDYCRKFSTLLYLYGATLSTTIPKNGPPVYAERLSKFVQDNMLMGVVSG